MSSCAPVHNERAGQTNRHAHRGTGQDRYGVETAGGHRLAGRVVRRRAVLFSLRDLTERRRFEVARNEEARLRSLVQNAATVTFLISPTGLVDSVSGALDRVLGHDPELVEQRPLAELVYEADRPDLLDAFERASLGASARPGHSHCSSSSATKARRRCRSSSHGSTCSTIPLSRVSWSRPATSPPGSRSSSELRKTLSLLTATLDSTADGILVVDTVVGFRASTPVHRDVARARRSGGEGRRRRGRVPQRAVGLAGGVSGKGSRALRQPRGRVPRHFGIQGRSVFERYSSRRCGRSGRRARVELPRRDRAQAHREQELARASSSSARSSIKDRSGSPSSTSTRG